MAPRHGGSGGSGGGSSSSGSSSSCYNSDGELYPCSVPFYDMYGDIQGPLYSDTDLRGQLITYACWIVIISLTLAVSFKPGTRVLQLAMLSFIASFAFLCARYTLLITESEVPVAFRYESSVVVLMWRIGTVALLASTLPSLKGKVSKIYVWIGLAAYAGLSITFVVYDFLISSVAVKGFKSSPLDYGWKITDRDFGLTLTQAMLDALEENAQYYGDSGWVVDFDNEFVHDKLYDVYDGLFHQQRMEQARIGVAADIVALLLVVSLILIAIAARSGRTEYVTSKVSNWHQHISHSLLTRIVEMAYHCQHRLTTYRCTPRNYIYSLRPSKLECACRSGKGHQNQKSVHNRLLRPIIQRGRLWPHLCKIQRH